MNIFGVVTSFSKKDEKSRKTSSCGESSMFNNDIFEKYSNYNNLYEFRSKFRLDESIFNCPNQFFKLSAQQLMFMTLSIIHSYLTLTRKNYMLV